MLLDNNSAVIRNQDTEGGLSHRSFLSAKNYKINKDQLVFLMLIKVAYLEANRS